MKINNPDLAPFAETTASVLTDNASTYDDLLDQLGRALRPLLLENTSLSSSLSE